MRDSVMAALIILVVLGMLYVLGLGLISFLQVFQIGVDNLSEF